MMNVREKLEQPVISPTRNDKQTFGTRVQFFDGWALINPGARNVAKDPPVLKSACSHLAQYEAEESSAQLSPAKPPCNV